MIVLNESELGHILRVYHEILFAISTHHKTVNKNSFFLYFIDPKDQKLSFCSGQKFQND